MLEHVGFSATYECDLGKLFGSVDQYWFEIELLIHRAGATDRDASFNADAHDLWGTGSFDGMRTRVEHLVSEEIGRMAV